MRILINGEGLQARHHLRDNLRLGALITRLISTKHTVLFSCGQVLTREELDSCDVLLMTSRKPGQYPPAESREIRDFVSRGGGLLLLANHADTEDSEDLTLHAAQLA